MPLEIDAGYLGGHPDHPDPIEDGQIVVSVDAITFVRESMENMIRRQITVFSVDRASVTDVSDEAGMKVRRKGGMASYAALGVGGLAYHAATRGRANRPLRLAVSDNGRQFACHYAARPHDVDAVLSALRL